MVDQNLLFNKNTRILAVDDCPFSREYTHTNIIAMIIRRDLYIESIFKKEIDIDGMDVTEKIKEVLAEHGQGVRVVMVKGITFGGFNILDTDKLYRASGIPIINLMDHRPDMEAITKALKKHFSDWDSRLSLIGEFSNFEDDLYIQAVGIDTWLAVKFVKKLVKNGKIPEPLRLVDLIASVC